MALAVAGVIWLLDLFKELVIDLHSLITILSDIKAAMQIAANPIFMKEQSILFIWDKIKDDIVKTFYVPTRD